MTENERVKQVRKAKSLTMREFGQRLGLGSSTISDIENGRRNLTTQNRISICREFNVREEWLRMGEGDMTAQADTVSLDELVTRCGLDGEEKAVVTQMLVKYFELQADTRRDIMSIFLRGLKAGAFPAAENQRGPRSAPTDSAVVAFLPIQLSRQPTSAGTGAYLGPEEFKTVYVQKNSLTERTSFAVPVSGNSMEPRFKDGDILLVEGADDISVGEIGIFTMDGDGYVKQRGENELISLNPAYDPIPMNDSIWCNGRVIGTLPKDWMQ